MAESIEGSFSFNIPVSYTHLDVYKRQELDVLADEIKDIFHQNSYGMMNIENNYIRCV